MIESATVQRAQGGAPDTGPPAISTASACLIKLISIGLSYRAKEPRYTFTRAIATVQAFVSAPTFTISIWCRYASLLITMSETPRASLKKLHGYRNATGPVRYASRLEISTIYPTGIGTRLTRAETVIPPRILRHDLDRLVAPDRTREEQCRVVWLRQSFPKFIRATKFSTRKYFCVLIVLESRHWFAYKRGNLLIFISPGRPTNIPPLGEKCI